MELTHVQTEVPLLQPAPVAPRRMSCFHWLSICSFVLLLVATVVFALLHFQIIPTRANQDEFQVPEVLHIKSFLDSAPQVQGQEGKRPAAHLTGKVKNNKIVWEASDMNTLQNEFILQKNSLRIPRDGLYFVYTQVVFTGKNCKGATDLTHTVSRKMAGLNLISPILTSTKTVCEGTSTSVWHQPIYQGGIFQLEEGDNLSTETTNVDLLNSNNGQVYLGVLAI